jgi:hypothetical protein
MEKENKSFLKLFFGFSALVLGGCAPAHQGFLTKQYTSPYAPYYSPLQPFYQNYYAPSRYKYYEYYYPRHYYKQFYFYHY